MFLVHCLHSVNATQMNPNQNRCCRVIPVLFSMGPLQDSLPRLDNWESTVLLCSGFQCSDYSCRFYLNPRNPNWECLKNQVRQKILKILLSGIKIIKGLKRSFHSNKISWLLTENNVLLWRLLQKFQFSWKP